MPDPTARDTETLAEVRLAHDERESLWRALQDGPTRTSYATVERIIAARIEQARAGEAAQECRWATGVHAERRMCPASTAGETALRERVVHEAADALVAYARDTFWRDDSPFHESSRHSYEAAAAWLHEHAAQSPGEPTHLLAPKPEGDSLSLCGEQGHVTTTAADVTCGWCRVRAALDTTGGPT